MTPAPSPAAVRPIVLALAPPAAGLSRGLSIPSLEQLGGSLLIERLLATLRGEGLPAPLVITAEAALPQLRAALGRSAQVVGAPEGRRDALRTALELCDEELLLIHDAERALTPGEVVRTVLGALRDQDDGVVPVAAMTDSVKEVRAEGLRNIDRTTLAGLQSPRLLRRGTLEAVLAATAGTEGAQSSGGAGDHAIYAPGHDAGGFDEIRAALEQGARVRSVHGSHAGFAVLDRLSFWQAQISLGLARDTSHRHGLARRS